MTRLTHALPARRTVLRHALATALVGAATTASGATASAATASAATASGASGPVPPARALPCRVIDLSQWRLQVPVDTDGSGEVDTYAPEQLRTFSHPRYFTTTDSGSAVIFSAPVDGKTTRNSHYPRTELRELDGDDLASWPTTSGVHEMHVRQAVTRLPAVKPDLIATQVHDGDSDLVAVRLRGEELALTCDRGEREVVLDPHYRLGTFFTVGYRLAEGRCVMTYQGAEVADVAAEADSCYFKAGAYVLSNPDRGERPRQRGEVRIRALAVRHHDGRR